MTDSQRCAGPAGAAESRRFHVGGLLGSAAPRLAAAMALAAAPLVSISAGASTGVSHSTAVGAAVGGDPCHVTGRSGALGPLKAPNCAGD
jgi:hypothetical protein